jgi:hypothetical protein
MPMKMKNRLTCHGAIVAKDVKSVQMETQCERSANNACRFHQPEVGGGRDIQECFTMLLGKDQCVTEVNRPFVKNANGCVILKEDLSRSGPLDNAAVRHPGRFLTNETD